MSNNVKLQEDLPMLLVCFKQYIYSSKITLKNYLKFKGIMQSASGLQKKKREPEFRVLKTAQIK